VKYLKSKAMPLRIEATADGSMDVAEADDGSLEDAMDEDVEEGGSTAQSPTNLADHT
jgi:cobalamin biosynthesis protein CobT